MPFGGAPRSWLSRPRARSVPLFAEGEEARSDESPRENEETAGEATRRLLHEADQVRAREAAEVADRVDERDARGRPGAAQERRGHRPERAERARRAERGEREGRERRNRRAEIRDQRQAERPDESRPGDVPASLARAIRGPADHDHPD